MGFNSGFKELISLLHALFKNPSKQGRCIVQTKIFEAWRENPLIVVMHIGVSSAFLFCLSLCCVNRSLNLKSRAHFETRGSEFEGGSSVLTLLSGVSLRRNGWLFVLAMTGSDVQPDAWCSTVASGVFEYNIRFQ